MPVSPFTSLVSPSCMGTDILVDASIRERKKQPKFLDGVRSLRGLTVADLKADPALTAALRSLRASMIAASGGSASENAAATVAAPKKSPIRPATVHVGSLRAPLHRVAPQQQQQQHRAAPQIPRAVVRHSEIDSIRALTPAAVARDPSLRETLKRLQQRTHHLNTLSRSHKFSALGELGPVTSHAGKDSIASIGPGWMGPHRLMESHRRPLGPGKR